MSVNVQKAFLPMISHTMIIIISNNVSQVIWGVLTSITLFVCFLVYIYKRCIRRESYTEIPTTCSPQIPSINSNSTFLLFHITSESQPFPTFPSMPLEMITLEDEEEPVSSKTRRHTSRKKIYFAEVSLQNLCWCNFFCYVMLVMSQTVSLVWNFSSPCQRQCEKGNVNFCYHLASIVCRMSSVVCHQLTFHINIFFPETALDMY